MAHTQSAAQRVLQQRAAAPLAGAVHEEEQLTNYECLAALALYTFARRRVDVALVETGLGARRGCPL